MENDILWQRIRYVWQLLKSSLDLPWSNWIYNLFAAWDLVQSRVRRGLYEVLDYETVLDLKDAKGNKAVINKYEKVRYLRDNIIAFQDQAWGDGKILVNYHCTPGKPVDTYRLGYKYQVLISLHEVKNRGDIDEFHISWGIQGGFLLPTGFWATEISHSTDKIKTQIIFPKTRPPLKAEIIEKDQQRTTQLGKNSIRKLPNGKWKISWALDHPRLYEQYILKWVW
jgi:hypothetical protein